MAWRISETAGCMGAHDVGHGGRDRDQVLAVLLGTQAAETLPRRGTPHSETKALWDHSLVSIMQTSHVCRLLHDLKRVLPSLQPFDRMGVITSCLQKRRSGIQKFKRGGGIPKGMEAPRSNTPTRSFSSNFQLLNLCLFYRGGV